MIVTSALVACALLAQSGWSMSAGPERLSFRDISRFGPPADASPVAWEGDGPSAGGIYTREGANRFHRFHVDLAHASSFAYAGPVVSTPAPRGDRLARIDGRYEYRRYMLDDLFIRGFDAGAGVQGIARRLSFTRGTTTGEHHQSETMAAIAGSIAARWHRSPRWSAELAWVNGVALLHEGESQEGQASFESSRWGGGWLTDLSLLVAVRLSGPWSLSAGYFGSGEGIATGHNSFAYGRRRLTVGMSYAR